MFWGVIIIRACTLYQLLFMIKITTTFYKRYEEDLPNIYLLFIDDYFMYVNRQHFSQKMSAIIYTHY